MPDCPVCLCSNINSNDGRSHYDCPRCGEFWLTGSAAAMLPEAIKNEVHGRALMSHALRRTASREAIHSRSLATFWENKRLPTAAEQLSNLILYIGDNQLAPDMHSRCAALYLGAWLGTALLNPKDPHQGAEWLLDYAVGEGLIERDEDEDGGRRDNPVILTRLTMRGWDRYAELKTKREDSRTAFMAMRFGDETLDRIVEQCFKPAVSQTGFELLRLNDNQGAGLIDNQMRARILASRFLLADLSHTNAGAYWEAGFAEGLNIPVIYTCRSAVWETERTHFDTNHMVTIIWDENNPDAAANNLKATIRATFRSDALQTDS